MTTMAIMGRFLRDELGRRGFALPEADCEHILRIVIDRAVEADRQLALKIAEEAAR